MGPIERRSGIDSRSESEKQIAGERRSGIERRSRLASTGLMPSNEQLVLFGRRLRRAMRDEKGRGFFGVASGEDHFTFYSEVVRLIDWGRPHKKLLEDGGRHRGRCRPAVRTSPRWATSANVIGARRQRPLHGRKNCQVVR